MTDFQIKLQKRNSKIINFVNEGKCLSEILETFDISYSCFRQVCRKEKVKFPNESFYARNPQFAERNEKIINLIESGCTYKNIAIKFKISKQRVVQIAKTKNISSIKIRKEKYKKTIKEINERIQNGEFFVDVYKQYKVSKLVQYGLISRFEEFYKKRNKEIVLTYKNGNSAKSILKKPCLKISCLNRIYQIISEQNSNRYPNMIRVKKGHINESVEMLNIIKKLRKKKMSFKEISNYLNKKNYKTISNKPFTMATTRLKYIQSLK